MTNQNTSHVLSRIMHVSLGLVLPVLVLAVGILYLGGNTPAADAAGLKVGLITDVGTLNDKSFNWVSYQGLLRARTELGIVATVYTSTSSNDYTTNLQQCATDGNALCISVGFLTADAISNTAAAITGTKFAILDFAYQSYPGNLRGIVFTVSEASYMAGILAGSMSQTKIIADIGGMEISPVTIFTLPFRNGAQCAFPSATTLLTYTNDFGNPDLGAQVAQTLIAQGADVVFSPAGLTSVGAVLTATQSGKWGIGVDTDYYNTVYAGGTITGSNRLLTSVLKKLDNAVYFTIQDVISNTFTAGTKEYNLAADGVGLAPYHATDADIPVHIKARVEQTRQSIIAGRIDVNSTDCGTSYVFLPLVTK